MLFYLSEVTLHAIVGMLSCGFS